MKTQAQPDDEMHDGPQMAAEKADDHDPAELSDELREMIEQAHKERRESRPDENWNIRPAERPESIAPYKKNEDDMDAVPDVLTSLRSMGLPHYDEGGPVADATPDDFDPNKTLQAVAPAGTGTLTPSPAVQETPLPLVPQTPSSVAPLPAVPVAPDRPRAIAPPAPLAPATTDANFMTKANNMLGLNPDQQAAFLRMLGHNAQKGQIGAAIAGLGDAIASGGTLGKVNPGALARSEDLIQGKTHEGLEGMETLRGNNEKTTELAQKLEAQDPNSPLSKFAQNAYAGIGKKLGLDLSHASASMIADVSGKGVEALNTEYQNQLKIMGLDLQKKQVEATIGNQKAERDIARQGQQLTATEKLGSRTLGNKLESIIPGTPANTEKTSLERIASGGNESSSGPVKVNSMDEYKALPPGTHYVDSFGTEKVKK